MKIQASGIMEGEGPGETQARSGLHRIITQSAIHNPAREDRASQPEHHQRERVHDHVPAHVSQWLYGDSDLMRKEGGEQ